MKSILLILLAAISSISIMFINTQKNDKILVQYDWVNVETKQKADKFEVNAEIESKTSIKISNSDEIKFTKIFVKEGDLLNKGAPIALIEMSNEKEKLDRLLLEEKLQNIQIEKQIVSLEKLEDDLEENEALFRAKAILKDELEKKRIEYKNAKLTIRELQLKHEQILRDLESINKRKQSIIKSPIEGIVYSSPNNIFDDYIDDKQEIEIFDSKNLNLAFYVDAMTFRKIDIGMKVTTSNNSGSNIHGVVDTKIPYPDQENKKNGKLRYKIIAKIVDASEGTLVGEKVSVSINLGKLITKYYVPFDIYINESNDDQKLEFYDKNGDFKIIKVEFGEVENDKLEIIGGNFEGYKVKVRRNG